jgi:hypothetical protein
MLSWWESHPERSNTIWMLLADGHNRTHTEWQEYARDSMKVSKISHLMMFTKMHRLLLACALHHSIQIWIFSSYARIVLPSHTIHLFHISYVKNIHHSLHWEFYSLISNKQHDMHSDVAIQQPSSLWLKINYGLSLLLWMEAAWKSSKTNQVCNELAFWSGAIMTRGNIFIVKERRL